MSAASARLSIGGVLHPSGLYRTPVPAPVTTPGEVSIILGTTMSGLPVIVTATSLEWLDDLEEAIREARAAGVVQAGMTRMAVTA